MDGGHVLPDTMQATAVYELSALPEYREISLPILDYYLTRIAAGRDEGLFRSALLHSQSVLRDTEAEAQ